MKLAKTPDKQLNVRMKEERCMLSLTCNKQTYQHKKKSKKS